MMKHVYFDVLLHLSSFVIMTDRPIAFSVNFIFHNYLNKYTPESGGMISGIVGMDHYSKP